MAAPQKDHFGPDLPARIAAAIEAVHPTFPTDSLLHDASTYASTS